MTVPKHQPTDEDRAAVLAEYRANRRYLDRYDAMREVTNRHAQFIAIHVAVTEADLTSPFAYEYGFGAACRQYRAAHDYLHTIHNRWIKRLRAVA